MFFEMNCVRGMDGINDADLQIRTKMVKQLAGRVYSRGLTCFGHIDRMLVG